MNELGDYLKDLRGEKSLRQASKDIGISHTYLDSLEKGFDPRTKKERTPTREVLRRISAYYTVPYILLLHKAGYINEVKKYVEEVEMSKERAKELFDLDIEEVESSFLNNPGFVDTTDKKKRMFIPEKFKLDGETKVFDNDDFLNLYNLISLAVDKNNYLPFTNSRNEKIDAEELKKLLPIIKSLYN